MERIDRQYERVTEPELDGSGPVPVPAAMLVPVYVPTIEPHPPCTITNEHASRVSVY
jgi:hypothetical protein